MSEDTSNDLPALAGQYADAAHPVPPALDLDVAKYLPELDGLDIEEARKTELVQLLWSIMRSFVELGVSVDICGQIFGESAQFPAFVPDDVSSAHSEEGCP